MLRQRSRPYLFSNSLAPSIVGASIAVLELLKDDGNEALLDSVFDKCLAAGLSKDQENHVKELYAPYSYEEVSAKITEIVRPEGMKAELEVVYQTVDDLHRACPNHLGDWYFTGDYPTPGGNRVVNRAFVNFMKGVEVRAY